MLNKDGTKSRAEQKRMNDSNSIIENQRYNTQERVLR